MRAWLWILGAAAGLAGAAHVAGKRLRQRAAVARFLRAILDALDADKLSALMNQTVLHADGWSDEYAGMLAGETFIFLVRVQTVNGIEPPGGQRLYTLRWGQAQMTVLSRPDGDKETAYMRIHALLRTAYRRFNGQAPS